MLLVFFQHALSYSKEDLGFDIDHFGSLGFLWQACAWCGVWIFFILSGYLIGKGFVTKRYSTDKKGIFKFYLARFLKLGIPTYIIAFLVSVIDRQTFFADNPWTLLRFLIFTYNGSVGVSGIGALWYVSTLMQLYVLAPFIYLLAEKLLSRLGKNRKRTVLLMILGITAIEGIYRFCMLWIDLSWYEFVYTPFFGNLDLFVSGMLLNYITVDNTEQERDTQKGKLLKIFAGIALAMAVLVGCYSCYYDRIYYFYIAACPVVFLAASLFYLYAFDSKRSYGFASPTLSGVIRNPATFVNFLSGISFEFYVVHISVIYHVYQYIHTDYNTVIHMKLLIITGLLSVLVACCLKKVFSGIRLPKLELSDFTPKERRRSVAIVLCAALCLGGIYVWARVAEIDIDLEGKGSREEPYLISDADDLVLLSEAVDRGETFKGRYFKMTSDVDMSSVSDFSPIGSNKENRSFKGVFDGNGYVIESLSVIADEDSVGLFVNTSGAVITNLGIEGGDISGKYCGAIVSGGSGEVINCYSRAYVSGARAGAITDEFDGDVINCWSDSELFSDSDAVGISTFLEEETDLSYCYITQKTADGAEYIDGKTLYSAYFAKLLNLYVYECEEYSLVPYKFNNDEIVFKK